MTTASDCTLTGEPAGALERFRVLLLEISLRFVHLPADRIDGEIEDGLRRVCELLGVQRSALWQCPTEDPDRWQLTHFYQDPDHATLVINEDGEIRPRDGWTRLQPKTPPRRMEMDAREYFPWVCDRLRRHEIVVVDSLGDLQLDLQAKLLRALQTGEFERLGSSKTIKIDEVEAEHIRRILRDVGWRIAGKGGAADLLGLNPSTLRGRMRKLNIRRAKDSGT